MAKKKIYVKYKFRYSRNRIPIKSFPVLVYYYKRKVCTDTRNDVRNVIRYFIDVCVYKYTEKI